MSDVYVELIGGKQTSLTFDNRQTLVSLDDNISNPDTNKQLIKDRNFLVESSELEKHESFINTIENAIWKNYK